MLRNENSIVGIKTETDGLLQREKTYARYVVVLYTQY